MLRPIASIACTDATVKTSPGRATGSGRSSRASAKLKMAQFAPMPMASEKMAMLVNPGLPASRRHPYLMSCQKRSIQTIISRLDGAQDRVVRGYSMVSTTLF